MKHIFLRNNLVSKLRGILFSVLLVTSIFCRAEAPNEESGESFEYPLLQVTPRASESLQRHFKQERKGMSEQYYPIQISAIATMTAGFLVSGDYKPDATPTNRENVDLSSTVAIGVGAAWLGATVAMSYLYKPYRKSYSKIKKMASTKRREILARERLAEEGLISPSKTGFKLRMYSIFSNFVASGFVAASGQNESQAIGGVAAILSIIPLFYDTTYERNLDMHLDFKKRIYGPIAMALPVRNEAGVVSLAPGVQWNIEF